MCRFLLRKKWRVLGVDNNMRQHFFGGEASTSWNEISAGLYSHHKDDIRDEHAIDTLFKYHADIKLIVHCAAQPSHDWAAREPVTDFTINANGTLNLLEATRAHCPKAVFIYCSTSKVYGDVPNRYKYEELETRYEPIDGYGERKGICESTDIDQSLHSLFGVSKLAGDLLCQEYGRYFGMKTGIFRPGCLTGSGHSPTELHGFLAYMMKCAINGTTYKIFGYKGKQVRDNIHSEDLCSAFWQYAQYPKKGEVYNIGGGRFSNCSLNEAIAMCEEKTGKKMITEYIHEPRIGDHQWYISDCSKFMNDYPDWKYRYNMTDIINDLYEGMQKR
jgi:CDP-paratose 2-epimerase